MAGAARPPRAFSGREAVGADGPSARPFVFRMIDIKRRLQDEINTLDYELKVELPKEILKAREHGDLRENAEYKSAKERQSYLQARIGQLHRRLAALSMINLDKIPRQKVGLGSSVTLRHVDTGDEVVYEIVVPEESDPPSGRISAMSPIGKCLLNHEEGDEVEVRVPAGSKTYEVVRLITIHDRLRDEEGVDTDKAEIGDTAGGSEA